MKKFIRLRKVVATLALALVTLTVSPMTVFAAPDAIVEYLNEHHPQGTAGKNDLGTIGNLFTTQADSTHTEAVTFGNASNPVTLFYNPSQETAILNKINNVSSAERATEKVTELTNNLSVVADTDQAATTLSGVVPFVNLVLGIISFFIILGLAVYTGFDICYIVFPVFRGKMDTMKAEGGNNVMTKTNKNGETELRFVSDEAQFAVKKAITSEGGQSALWIYVKKRIVAYILVVIVLFMFMTGNIDIITNLALKALSGVLRILAEL